ncbi:MAG: hypothetical protein J6V21_00475 [Alistipes sp.]|nr:hypothetical protein [Alistipes sp.]
MFLFKVNDIPKGKIGCRNPKVGQPICYCEGGVCCSTVQSFITTLDQPQPKPYQPR